VQRYKVPDMSCGHCTSTIEKAVKGVDPKAVVETDLSTHVVSVRTSLEASRIADAIRSAGYANEPLAA